MKLIKNPIFIALLLSLVLVTALLKDASDKGKLKPHNTTIMRPDAAIWLHRQPDTEKLTEAINNMDTTQFRKFTDALYMQLDLKRELQELCNDMNDSIKAKGLTGRFEMD